VRATHRPTGLTAVSQEQRSQHANRKIARLKLLMALDERHRCEADRNRQAAWARNRDLERGNAVRTYAGPGFDWKQSD